MQSSAAQKHRSWSVRRTVGVLMCMALASLVAACGSDGDTGVRAVSADDAFDTLFENPPEGLVVLDVRTPAEFNAQRLPDATIIDFYEPDFAARIAELDRDTPYLMYCRSGNRSGQARELMQDLGFTDVRDVDGGILSWLDAGHPFVTNG